jgi:Rrf2 family iron-sulfur cluster assembly transcriptional regulator
MRITTKGRYALRAVLSLVNNESPNPVSIKKIAQKEDLSPEFLEQIFFRLKKTDVITSTRGPGGGFRLNKDPEDVTLLEILEGAGEGTDLTPCSNDDLPGVPCERMEDCVAHRVWKSTARRVKDYLDKVTLQMIVENDGNIPDMPDI